MPDTKLYISQVTLPDSQVYYIKDAEARELIEDIAAGSLVFVKSTAAADTPEGVVWGDPPITGTLRASADTKGKIYLVPSSHQGAKDIFDEYVTVATSGSGTEQDPYVYAWELLGNTEIDFSSLGALAYKDTVVLNKQTDDVLGVSTTFTTSDSAVTFSGDSSDTFVKSYPGATSKLETATITGVAGEITFNAVDSDPGTVTASNITWGSDTTASKIETESKTATNVTFGTAETASKATAGTAVSVAKAAASATDVSYIGNANTDSVIIGATVNNENLSFTVATVQQSSVTGTNGTETITPYTFADVTVPNITAHSDVAIASVKTNTDITVPVVSAKGTVTASGAITLASKTAATKAASAQTVATGSLNANDTNGADVMTGLGTAVTATAITGLGTATAAAQTVTVGTNDQVTVLTSTTDVSVS